MYIISQYNSQKKRFKLFVGAAESHAEHHGRNPRQNAALGKPKARDLFWGHYVREMKLGVKVKT